MYRRRTGKRKYSRTSKRTKRSGGKYTRGYLRNAGNYGRYNPRTSSPVELKWLDTNWSSLPLNQTTTGSARPSLNLIGAGTGPNEMIGRKVTVKKIDILLNIYQAGNASLTPTTSASAECSTNYKVALVLDKQCNGAAAAFDDVYDTSAGAGYVPYSQPKMENSRRFQIIKEWFGTITNSSTGSFGAGTTGYLLYGRHRQPLKASINCEIPLEFNGSANPRNLADVRSNNIFIVAGGGYPTLNGNTNPQVEGLCRIRYSDA